MFFFFNDTATTEIYTLSLHDALPIFPRHREGRVRLRRGAVGLREIDFPETADQRGGAHRRRGLRRRQEPRSEEHTSELQSRQYLVCRLLLEKKKNHLRWVLTVL